MSLTMLSPFVISNGWQHLFKLITIMSKINKPVPIGRLMGDERTGAKERKEINWDVFIACMHVRMPFAKLLVFTCRTLFYKFCPNGRMVATNSVPR